MAGGGPAGVEEGGGPAGVVDGAFWLWRRELGGGVEEGTRNIAVVQREGAGSVTQNKPLSLLISGQRNAQSAIASQAVHESQRCRRAMGVVRE